MSIPYYKKSIMIVLSIFYYLWMDVTQIWLKLTRYLLSLYQWKSVNEVNENNQIEKIQVKKLT